MATDNTAAIGQTNNQNQAKILPKGKKADAFQDIDLKGFLDLMIAELQNQDPVNPMDNAQIMEQLGQLRSIASTDKLSKTLDSMEQGQSFAAASSLIGKQIKGLDDGSNEVTGKVDKATVADGAIRVHVGDKSVSLSNVREIQPAQ